MFTNRLLKIKLLTTISLVVIVFTVANMIGWYLFLPSELPEKKIVIIKSRLSIHEISILLEKEGVIKHRLLFELISKIYSTYNPLKSGEYEFTKGTSPYQVITTLAGGKSLIHRLVIPEGQTVSEIIEKVNAEDRLFGQINLNIPEGYLMPSTYFYTYGDLREKVIDEMRSSMSKALDEVMPKLRDDSPLKTRKEVLILASIVEKEAGNEQERPLIASVFINRLKKGMKLQADPTVIYAITGGKYKLERLLYNKDLQVDSLYNTYKIKGLPIGSIACPGLASLKAVVSPAKSDALYFVADGNGGHSFSRTLEEHNVHVKKFRQQRAK